MFNKPIAIDLSALCGKEIIQIAIGLFSVEVVCEDEIRVSCHGRIELVNCECLYQIFSDRSDETVRLVVLLGKRIADVMVSAEGNLKLGFSTDLFLTIENSNEHYESYVVWNKGDFVAV